jgi:pimeloyl-ACP methyl ester carboxylesterase
MISEPIMKKVKGYGVDIQLAIWKGTGKQVLCVHGITANCRCWDLVASALSPKYQVLAMDLRGRGLSEKPPTGYSLEQHVRDIGCLIEAMGLEKVVLMGHSLGAFISLAFGAKYPERVGGLVLIDGGGQLTEEQWDKVALAIKPSLYRLGRIFPSSDAYIEAMKSTTYLHPWSSAIENCYRYEVEEVEGGVKTNIDPAHIQEEAENIRKVVSSGFYGEVTANVLILRATEGLISQDDLLLPEAAVEEMLQKISNARSVDIVGTNHFSILFQPNEMRDQTILEFFSTKGWSSGS